jgi:hypothetical protein
VVHRHGRRDEHPGRDLPGPRPTLLQGDHHRFRKAAKEKGISADERRAREYFQAYLAGEYLSQSTAKYDDKAQNAALQATVRLPWMKDPVPTSSWT